jgi:hypothetical protein
MLEALIITKGRLAQLDASGRTVTLGSTQSMKEMSTRELLWRQRRLMCRADNLATFMWRLSGNPGSLSILEPSRPSLGLYRDSCTIYCWLWVSEVTRNRVERKCDRKSLPFSELFVFDRRQFYSFPLRQRTWSKNYALMGRTSYAFMAESVG